jgi:hypothetical protein
MTPRQLLQVLVLAAVVLAGGAFLGAAAWGRAGQLALVATAAIIASLGAPGYVAWRQAALPRTSSPRYR